MNTETTVSDALEFSSLPWHDSEFLGWSVASGDDDEAIVTFDVRFRKSEVVTGRAAITFHHCRGFFTDVDFLAKSLCGHQIASGYREDAETSKAAFVKQLDYRFDLYRGESMQGLFVFGVKLIHPAGELVVIARSFSLSKSTP